MHGTRILLVRHLSCSAFNFLGGRSMVYLVRVLSRHLGFAKRGELGRVKEGEEGGNEGGGKGRKNCY